MRPKFFQWLLLSSAVLAPAAPAMAQTESGIIAQAIPFDYDRDRNVSVTERPRPDYDALGIRAGGFLVYPRAEVGTGFTDNVYLSEGSSESDGYLLLAPSVRAQSDWSRHALSLAGGAQFRRFFDATLRNEDAYYLRGLGRADLGDALSVTAEAQAGKIYETPFSNDGEALITGVSSYVYNMQGLRGQYSLGRVRTTLAYARNEFDFRGLTNGGTRLDQSDRDRIINSVVGQVQYALSPSFATFVQASYSDTEYDRNLLNGQPNRDSQGYRLIAGVNMDLSALMRGSVGVGYTHRDYDNALYPNEGGLSVEAQVEYFLSELTTVSVRAQRTIEDSNLSTIGSFYNNRLQLRVDHELLRNLILNASADYAHQDYIRSDRSNDVYRIGGGAQFLMSPIMSTRLRLDYAKRDRDGTGFQGSLNEFRADVSLVFQR
ncbi:outer membrane beta-barrel protein [Allosphingosinicella deserti]|uniref:Outer membrane beta-barrel protein n=1 Tax=Allosphingosinicella deserti TaxID=2116704 RepID=A0A2P7QJV1_9SPHN|nr:outer membrane beta-barrel protein [Sphingomonas deserti]PSJ38275.1 hypothetical protein C7I55_17605 [Sphingomonas deserti]